jgi:hypothetical protein
VSLFALLAGRARFARDETNGWIAVIVAAEREGGRFARDASRATQSNKLSEIVFEFVHIPVMQEFARLILSMQEP